MMRKHLHEKALVFLMTWNRNIVLELKYHVKNCFSLSCNIVLATQTFSKIAVHTYNGIQKPALIRKRFWTTEQTALDHNKSHTDLSIKKMSPRKTVHFQLSLIVRKTELQSHCLKDLPFTGL